MDGRNCRAHCRLSDHWSVNADWSSEATRQPVAKARLFDSNARFRSRNGEGSIASKHFYRPSNSNQRRQLNRGAMQQITKFTLKPQLAKISQPCPTHYPKPCGALLDNKNKYDYSINRREIIETGVSHIELICKR
ncbi:hypothetical protein MRX96_053630 [Rhipicephalus microplus]